VIAIGRITYPSCLPSGFRITRPTACTMSIFERRGVRNITASSAGTSTPSVRHLALVSTRHSVSAGVSFSQRMSVRRLLILVVPSTCRVGTASGLTSSPRDRLELVEVRGGHLLELLRKPLRVGDLRPECHGPLHDRSSPLKPAPAAPGSFASAERQPTKRATSGRLSSPFAERRS